MAEPHVITALVRKRAELAGDIENAHETLRKMITDLESFDAALLLFDPDYKLESIKPKAFRPPKDWSNRGQMTRICLSILRQASEPLNSRDIALQLLVERALDKDDQRLLRLMTKRVGVALRGQREKGTVRAEQGAGPAKSQKDTAISSVVSHEAPHQGPRVFVGELTIGQFRPKSRCIVSGR